ncbi:universal stress protein [Allokutzneria oryzae]|uniref:Universal stress protein n=1 Tax=Allokutzneria oryzae TaxID=1378989 RepID=A0ABV6A3A5_9PSEU
MSQEAKPAKPIVVGIDGSEFSVQALRWAVSEAHRAGTSVSAIMAWQPYAVAPSSVPLPVLEQSVSEAEQRGLRETLAEAVERGTSGLPEVEVRAELVPGPPGMVLADASAHARLLVLGSHGRGYLVTALIGSVALACVRDSLCPVLVLPPGVTRRLGEDEQRLAAGPSTH